MSEWLTANEVKCWFVKRDVSVTYIHICMSVLSDDVECISTGDHDQNNVKSLINQHQCISVRFEK